jgi:hypothetical protein
MVEDENKDWRDYDGQIILEFLLLDRHRME